MTAPQDLASVELGLDTFGDVPEGQPLVYFNSEDKVALAINYGNFAEDYGIEAGPDWRVELRKP